MAPTAANPTTSLPVSAAPKKGSWSLEYLTFLHQIYTEFAFADPKKRSQHVIAIFQKIFEFDLLITHPNELEDRHVPDKYLARNKAGRKGRFKEVEAEQRSPEQQARVNKIMPLIRSAITDLGFQRAISEAQVPVAENNEDGEEDGEADEEVDEEEHRNDVEVGRGEGERIEADDHDGEGQSRRDAPLQRGTKRKQSPDLAQTESASKRSRPAAASAVVTVASERPEQAEDGVGGDGPAPTNDGGERRRVARSSTRRTTQSNRLQEAIADGGSGVIGTETNAAAAAASSNISFPAPSQVKQKNVKKASRATSSWDGPVTEQRKGKKDGAQRTGSEQDPIDVDDEQSVLDLLSTDKTANLLRHLQKAKLNGNLVKSSDPAALSKHLYKINNPLATQINEAFDWQDTQRRMFNRWADEEGAMTARTLSGEGGSHHQGREGRQGKPPSATMLGDDDTSVLGSPSKASDALVNTTSQQLVETLQRPSTNPFGFRPMPNYSRYPDLMAEGSIPRPQSGLNSLRSGVDAGTARQHEGSERLRLVATVAQLPPLGQDQHTPTPASGAVSSNRRSLFDAIHSRRDSAISLSSTQQPSTQPLQTPPTYVSHLAQPTNALLLRPFYGTHPRARSIASNAGRTDVSVQSGSGSTSAKGDEPATMPNSPGENDDSAQSLR
ncbi:hypothetical protein LTR17_025824 [Elasticomyces elasticus]|nr:hypothetical protein LTR17_025824 [Elasticomyces elasticus]